MFDYEQFLRDAGWTETPEGRWHKGDDWSQHNLGSAVGSQAYDDSEARKELEALVANRAFVKEHIEPNRKEIMTAQEILKLQKISSIPKSPKLGKRAPRIDRRTLKMADYLPRSSNLMVGALKLNLSAPPTAPSSAGYVSEVGDWGMDLNDQLGDCTIACAAHEILQWSTYAGTPKRITDAEILTAYEAVSGYIPGDPSTDNGAVILDVLNYWRKTGIGGDKLSAYVSVNWQDREELKQAIALFGNVNIGIQLPISAQNTTAGGNGFQVWEVPAGGAVDDGSPGSWGGHCVPIVGFRDDGTGASGTQVITWGAVYDMTWNFLNAYVDEAYCLLSNDWLEKVGESPSGFDLAELKADLAAL